MIACFVPLFQLLSISPPLSFVQDENLKLLESRVDQLEHTKEKCSRLESENATLVSQKKELESTIKELQGLSQTVAEMEEKLKDLQAKLQGEAQEKRELVTKFEEVSVEVQ